MRVRKIGFYTSGGTFGGLEKNALRFMQWLVNEQNRLFLFTLQNSGLGKAAAAAGIPVNPFAKPHFYLDIKKARQLTRLLKREKIQVLIILRPRDILMAALIKTVFHRGLKLIFFQQSFLDLHKHPILYTLLFRPFDAWIAPSLDLGKKNLSFSHFNPSKMIIVPPCIDAEHFDQDTLTKKAARKVLDLPANTLLIGAVGRANKNTRMDFFIRAIQFLSRHEYSAELLIMAKAVKQEEKEYLEFLRDLARECKIEHRVHFRAYDDKFITFFRSLDIFVTNCIPPPHDLIIPKAMASGAVVVAPFSEINTEMLGKGNYGMLYNRTDMADFSAKVIHLITQPKLMNHLKKTGRMRALEDYDRRVGCARLDDLIGKLLD